MNMGTACGISTLLTIEIDKGCHRCFGIYPIQSRGFISATSRAAPVDAAAQSVFSASN